jgi:hypothetical protein
MLLKKKGILCPLIDVSEIYTLRCGHNNPPSIMTHELLLMF